MAKLDSTKFSLPGGKQVVFRNLAPADVVHFLEFRRRVPEDSIHTLQYIGMQLPSVEETAAQLASTEADPLALNIGIFDGDKVAGSFFFRIQRAGGHPWVRHVGEFGTMILKEYWGQGLGKRLLELAETHARAVGVTRISALVRVKNERGLKLYLHSGYVVEGLHKNAAQIDGQYYDEYTIAKILDDEAREWRPPVLETDRLLLRPLEVSDADSIFAYAKNENVSRYTLWEPHASLKDTVNFIKDYAFANYRKKVPEPWGIVLKENPTAVIGTVGCFWVSQKDKSMELAYAIGEEYWGQGLVAEGSRAVMGYCFKEFALKRIQARCKIENSASARVMEKIGMSHEGTLRASLFHRGRHWDMQLYAEVIGPFDSSN